MDIGHFFSVNFFCVFVSIYQIHIYATVAVN